MLRSVRIPLLRLLVCGALIGSAVAIPGAAQAQSTTCGPSDGHTLCVTVPATTLVAGATIGITNNPNDGDVIVSWIPNGGASSLLIHQYAASPEFGDYSFVWPTTKYLDGSGTLRVQHGSISAGAVNVALTLSNGNTSDFQHSPNDWATFLPGSWTGSSNPVVAAVGDGPSDESASNAVAASIAASNTPLFLFLGDVYENGTFTEFRNHYGVSNFGSVHGTLWGQLASKTQPTAGNHEYKSGSLVAWTDYWHGRPAYTSFTFGGVLFLDLDANQSLDAGSAQYDFVQNALGSAPACVVAFWHQPALWKNTVDAARQPMWSLLAQNGGDLVLNGHQHSMAVYKPLNQNLQKSGGHMVEIISGAGGHEIGHADVDSSGRLQFAKGKSRGILYLTLRGAKNGGTATSISWIFEDVAGNPLSASFGSVTC